MSRDGEGAGSQDEGFLSQRGDRGADGDPLMPLHSLPMKCNHITLGLKAFCKMASDYTDIASLLPPAYSALHQR